MLFLFAFSIFAQKHWFGTTMECLLDVFWCTIPTTWHPLYSSHAKELEHAVRSSGPLAQVMVPSSQYWGLGLITKTWAKKLMGLHLFVRWLPVGVVIYYSIYRSTTVTKNDLDNAGISAIRQFASAFPTAALAGRKGSNVNFFRLNSVARFIASPLRNFCANARLIFSHLTAVLLQSSWNVDDMRQSRLRWCQCMSLISHSDMQLRTAHDNFTYSRSWQRTSYRKSSHTSQCTSSVWRASQRSRVHTIIGWSHCLLSLPYWNLTTLLPCRYLPCWHLTATLAFTTNFRQLIPQAVAETCCTLAASAPAIGNSSSSWNAFCPSSDSKVNTSLLFSYHIPFTVLTYSLPRHG